MKAFLIGGTGSGCGKTTLTLGLLRAFTRRGLKVQPYKVGPDYIDTGWHSAVSGVASRNLDAFMLPASTLNWLYNQHMQAADIAVIEGVMGLLEHHILIRHCANYPGLSADYYRVAIKNSRDNDRLIAALTQILSDG